MRLFYALELDDRQKEKLIKMQKDLARYFRRSRQTPADNFHITLRFIGETSDSRAGELVEVLEEVARQTSPFSFELDEVGCFRRKKGNIWFAGMENLPSELVRMKTQMENMLSQRGYEEETRPFRPHVTLFRDVKETAEREYILEKVSPPAVRVNCHSIVLMESRQQDRGVVYTPYRKSTLEGE